jgi:hypothetical protein
MFPSYEQHNLLESTELHFRYEVIQLSTSWKSSLILIKNTVISTSSTNIKKTRLNL